MECCKISVVTVVYNDVDHIENTIQSVLEQVDGFFEYIIIDGGSTDGTCDIINKYRDKLAYFVSEKDGGIYDAMNKSISVCKGEYVIFMNSGDRFVNKNTINKVFCDDWTQDVIYGDALYYYGKNPVRVIAKSPKVLKYQMPFNHQATFVKVSLLKKYPFDTKYRYAADYDFFHKLYVNECSFLHVNVDVSEYHLEGGASQKNVVNCYKEVSQISTARDLRHYYIMFHAYMAEFYYKFVGPRFLNIFRRLKY